MHFVILTRHLPVLSLSKYSLIPPKRPAHLLREQTFAVTIRPIRPMSIQKIHFSVARNRWSSERRDQARLGFPES